MDMRDHIKEKTDLAKVYAEDGAYHTAARVLKSLAETVENHANDRMNNLREVLRKDRDKTPHER